MANFKEKFSDALDLLWTWLVQNVLFSIYPFFILLFVYFQDRPGINIDIFKEFYVVSSILVISLYHFAFRKKNNFWPYILGFCVLFFVFIYTIIFLIDLEFFEFDLAGFYWPVIILSIISIISAFILHVLEPYKPEKSPTVDFDNRINETQDKADWESWK